MMPGSQVRSSWRGSRADPETTLLPVVMITSLDPYREQVNRRLRERMIFSPSRSTTELFARVRSLLRVKSLQDEVKKQSDALKEWNVNLEERVREQLAQLDRMAQLKRFFAVAVAEAILSAGEQSILAPHRREISYVFADLRGFTAFIDSAEQEDVQALLREYQGTMGNIVAEFEGTLDRFAGDGILIFFNDPLPYPITASALRAWRSPCRTRLCRCASAG